jgi:hypothetical protein
MWQRRAYKRTRSDEKRSDGWLAHQQEEARCTILNGTFVVLRCHQGTAEETLDRVIQCVNALWGVEDPNTVRTLLEAIASKDKQAIKRAFSEVRFTNVVGNGSVSGSGTDSRANLDSSLHRVDRTDLSGLETGGQPGSSRKSALGSPKHLSGNQS